MACGSKGEHYIPLKQRVGPNFKICFASSSVATRTVSETGCRMLGVFEVKNEILIWRWNYERSPIRANFSGSTILDCRESLLECILQRASDCRIRDRDQGRWNYLGRAVSSWHLTRQGTIFARRNSVCCCDWSHVLLLGYHRVRSGRNPEGYLGHGGQRLSVSQ